MGVGVLYRSMVDGLMLGLGLLLSKSIRKMWIADRAEHRRYKRQLKALAKLPPATVGGGYLNEEQWQALYGRSKPPVPEGWQTPPVPTGRYEAAIELVRQVGWPVAAYQIAAFVAIGIFCYTQS